MRARSLIPVFFFRQSPSNSLNPLRTQRLPRSLFPFAILCFLGDISCFSVCSTLTCSILSYFSFGLQATPQAKRTEEHRHRMAFPRTSRHLASSQRNISSFDDPIPRVKIYPAPRPNNLRRPSPQPLASSSDPPLLWDPKPVVEPRVGDSKGYKYAVRGLLGYASSFSTASPIPLSTKGLIESVGL